MIGGSAGVMESKYDILLQFGYVTRTTERIAVYRESDNVLYQFWEKRSLMQMSLNKYFTIRRISPLSRMGFYTKLGAGYTYGSYRGSKKTPEEQLLPIPGGGLFYNYKSLLVQTHYEYVNFNNQEVSPHRIHVTVGFSINLSRNKIKLKEEPTL